LNLLPEDKRQASSRALYVPTIALASLVLLVTGGLFAYGAMADRRYLETLESQIREIAPQANRAARLDRQIIETREKADAIDRFRLRSKEDMDALNDATRVLAPPVFLNAMNMSRQTVEMSGHADQAAGLLKLLDGTGKFQNSEFTMPIQHDATGESFSLRAQRKGITTQ
jgi:hypothetical protein